MVNAPLPRPTRLRNGTLALIALGFILAAWVAEAAGRERIDRLDLSRWGTDLDIPECLAIERYIARHFLPSISAAVGVDGLAFAVLCRAGRRGPMRAFGVLVWIVLLLSIGWHGLGWLVTLLFAG